MGQLQKGLDIPSGRDTILTVKIGLACTLNYISGFGYVTGGGIRPMESIYTSTIDVIFIFIPTDVYATRTSVLGRVTSQNIQSQEI